MFRMTRARDGEGEGTVHPQYSVSVYWFACCCVVALPCRGARGTRGNSREGFLGLKGEERKRARGRGCDVMELENRNRKSDGQPQGGDRDNPTWGGGRGRETNR